MNPSLHRAASGYLTLNFNDGLDAWLGVVRRLENVLGFVREGSTHQGFDEAIFPNFVSANCILEAGYDNWSGNYLLSQSAEGDKLLQEIFNVIHA